MIIKKSIIYILTAPFLAFLIACSSTNFPGAYKIDIHQGNTFSSSDIKKLTLGMSKHKVRSILGTNLAKTPLDNTQWVYIYTLLKQDQKPINKQLILTFNRDTLTIIDDTLAY